MMTSRSVNCCINALLPRKLKKIVGILRDPTNNPPLTYPQMTRGTDYFVRLAPRQYILTDKNEVQPTAVLGTKPFVFVTTPECIHGRTLLEIYEDIGYEGEDIILSSRNQKTVAIVFRFPKDISFSEVKDGQFSQDWDKKVYVPTWENVFSLFSRLVERGTIQFKSPAEKDFVLGFPQSGKDRIQRTLYITLYETGGADWEYRSLLEANLSVFQHFMGNGRTHNEVIYPDIKSRDVKDWSHMGLLEFVGPKMGINQLPEVAIIDMGQLGIEDTYSAKGIPPRKEK